MKDKINKKKLKFLLEKQLHEKGWAILAQPNIQENKENCKCYFFYKKKLTPNDKIKK